jgi:hypothetical protein
VAAVGALLWLLVTRAVRARRRSARVLAVVMTVITAALALLLLVSSEYGSPVFPPLCGTLAFLPPVAGDPRDRAAQAGAGLTWSRSSRTVYVENLKS